jgi:hypothetical protein
MGRADLSRAAFDSARTAAEPRVRAEPDEANYHSALAIAYAGLGRTSEAIGEARKAVELLPVSRDAWRGLYRLEDLARVYVMVGETDSALATLEQLAALLGGRTIPFLEIDPVWDPVRQFAITRSAGTRMEQAIQLFAAISFLVIGLSHLGQPKAWVTFYQALAARGTAGVFLEGFLLLNFGGIVVAFHNVWDGPALVLTLVGWAQVLKGIGRFLAPQMALRVLQRATPERAWYFQGGGVVALLLSGFLWWLRFWA